MTEAAILLSTAHQQSLLEGSNVISQTISFRTVNNPLPNCRRHFASCIVYP